jgi:formylmethanofuran dehydrogenase subunit E
MSEEYSNENTALQQIATFSDVVKFHGHICPGLTIGYIAAKAGTEELCTERDVDEEACDYCGKRCMWS